MNTNKSLGQHWLNDEAVLSSICETADLSANDVVLEIGPGLGALTWYLTDKAKRVVAVEFDSELAKALKNRVDADNLEVVCQDILKFNLSELPKNYKIVANIPYYLTSKLIRTISESKNPPIKTVLLVQKEVAERIAAKPGGMSLLSVTAQYYWEISLGIVVKAESFTPPPKVDSQVIIMDRRNEPLFDVDEKKFFRVVKAGFASRRKTLLNSLSGGLRITKSETKKLLENVEVDIGLRPQALSMSDWCKIYVESQKSGLLD